MTAKPSAFHWRWLDALIAATMTLAAAWIRLRALQLVPTLTDETDDVQFALRIVRDRFIPAVSFDTYNGPLLHYLLAPGLWLDGPAWPRLLVMLLGALTVGVTYFLGASLAATHFGDTPRAAIWSRLAGLIAAALLAVSFVPIVVNSHITWSNAATPFWTSLALLALAEAHRRAQPRLLVAAGALAGLALQTHPTAFVILLGAAVWIAVVRRAWLRTRWPWLALGAAALLTSNLIIYNVVSGGGSAEGAARRGYAFTGGSSLADYLDNMRGFVGLAYQMVGSTFISTLAADAGTPAMRHPIVIAYAALALAALLYTARRAGLPLACWLAAFLIFPYFNRAYDSHISARYMAALLPPTFAAMGILLAAGVAILRPTVRDATRTGRALRVVLGVGAILLIVTLISYPLARLDTYYFYELADGRNNARMWQIMDAVRAPTQDGAPLYLDRGLRDLKLDAGGHVYKALGMLLDLDHTPHLNPPVEELAAAPVGAYLVLTDARRDALASTFALEPLALPDPPAPAAPGGYWVYRIAGTAR
ncbi:MAG: glycosyltransferase family 39 protein [Anaerolineae bacterium]